MRRCILIGAVVAAGIGVSGSRAEPAVHRPSAGAPSGRLVVGLHPPERVAVVDVATGHRIVRRVPGGTLCHGPLLVRGGRLIRAGARDMLSVGLGLEGRAKTLGRANQVLPSVAPGRLWLATLSWRPGGVSIRGIREVTAAGRTIFVARHRAPGMSLVGALADGLLFEGDERLLVWDPHTGRVTRSISGSFVVATHDSTVARCTGGCSRLHLTEPGGERVVDLPAPQAYEGEFSPDGSLLAMRVRGGRIAIVDVEEGTASLAPAVRASRHGALAWAPDGGWLYFAAPGGAIAAYRPEDGERAVLPFRARRGAVLSLTAVP